MGLPTAVSWSDNTAASRSFTGVNFDGDGKAYWRDLTVAASNGQQQLALAYRMPVPQNPDHLYRLTGYSPILNSDGLVIRRSSFNLEFRVADANTVLEADDLVRMAYYGVSLAGAIGAAIKNKRGVA
jgi:hypothetical protein